MSLGMGAGGSDLQAGGGTPQPSVVYEIDTGVQNDAGAQASGADQVADGGAPGALGAAPNLTAAPDPRDARIATLERQNAETMAQLQPMLARLQAQQRLEAQRPPIDLDRLDDPAAGIKPSDFLKLINWQQEQRAAQVLAQAQAGANAVHSEQLARGLYSAAELGEGNDYDSMVSRYVAPLASQNPAIDQLISMAAPGDPATGRMIFATIIAAIDRAEGNVPKALKAVINGLGAWKQGARETVQAQARAAKVNDARVFSGRQSGGATERRSLRTAEDVWNMSDADFDRWFASQGR